jgi:hypothetical protein
MAVLWQPNSLVPCRQWVDRAHRALGLEWPRCEWSELDLLTVAQISGTSVVMIERHYGHLRGDIAASALARLAL